MDMIEVFQEGVITGVACACTVFLSLFVCYSLPGLFNWCRGFFKKRN